MSNKPVITIDVQSDQFRQFYELFQQYAAQVEELPDDWKKVNGATAEAGSAMGEFAKASDSSHEALMVAAIQADAISKSVSEAIKAQKEFTTAARDGNSVLEKMAHHAKALGSEVFGIGKFLMKLGALGIGATGLGAILSGLGIRDLARSAIQTQGEARAIGVTTGQLSAFETDFGRYVDPSILNRAAEGQSDWSKIPFAMMATRQSAAAIQNESPDELALRLMQRAHDWYSSTPVAMRTAQTLQGTGLDHFLSFDEVRKLGAMTPQEFADAQDKYRKDASAFNVPDKNVDAWYEFEREVEAAGKLIKTDLTDRLAELAPNLKDFIQTVGDDAKILIDDVLSPQNIKAAGDALNDFAKYLGSPRFRQDLHDIAGLFVELAKAMRKAAKFLGIDAGQDNVDASGPLDPDEVQRETHGQVRHFGDSPDITDADRAYFAAQDQADAQIGHGFGYIRHRLTMPLDADQRLADLDTKSNLPPGTLEEMWQQESGRGKALFGPMLADGDEAIGDFQFTAAAWKDWGHNGDRFDFGDESKAAGADMASLMKKYGGNIRKALAAYNWGMGDKNHPRLDADIARYGDQWESHLPSETRNYINKITAALARRSTVNLKVDVHNSTSARVAVSTNAAAVGS